VYITYQSVDAQNLCYTHNFHFLGVAKHWVQQVHSISNGLPPQSDVKIDNSASSQRPSGIIPTKELSCRVNAFKFSSSITLFGTVPVKKLLCTVKVLISGNFPINRGSVPLKKLLLILSLIKCSK